MKYRLIIDKQSRTNPSAEKHEYEIDIEELRVKGDIYDNLIVTVEEAYVMRRLSLSKYGVLRLLDKPVKEPLSDLNVQLFEGDNYIYLIDITGNRFYAEYIIKNDFTDIYITKSEVNSEIEQSAKQIEISVNEKLTDYATNKDLQETVTQLNSTIEAKAGEINLEVSKKVNDKDLTGANIALRINKDTSEAQIAADKINIEGKKVKFKTNTETQYTYSKSDIEKIKNYIMGTGTLTQAEIDLYDINNDGVITATDYGMIKNKITDNGGTFSYKGSFEINPDAVSRNVIIRDENGSIITSIGLYGMKTQSLGASSAKIKYLSYETLSQSSLKSKKKNIKKLKTNALELVKRTDICEYNFKGEKKGTKKHIGLVIGEGYNCPDEVISEDGQGVDQYSLTSLLYKAVQELTKKIERLEANHG